MMGMDWREPAGLELRPPVPGERPRCVNCAHCVITIDQVLGLPPRMTVLGLLVGVVVNPKLAKRRLHWSAKIVKARCRLGRWGEDRRGRPRRYVVATLAHGRVQRIDYRGQIVW